MAITLNGTTGITNDGGYTGDGVSFADTTPANTLVTTTGGNVGIGTTSPARNLSVVASSAPHIQLALSSDQASGNGFEIAFDGSANYIAGRENVPMLFSTNNTERMRIDTSGNLLFNSGYGSVATAYGCRAWVNFNGTGTVAIRASGNVSSVSDDGTGTYTINFTNAMPDANYNVVSNGPPNSTSVVGGLGFVVRNSSPSGSPSNKTTTQVQMMYAGTGSLVDASELYASVFR